MEIRALTGASWEELATAFNEAFSEYAVPTTITARALEDMQRRRGYADAVSYGAYDGGRLVGFVLTCREGDRLYNSGTGVAPSHRRRGIARRLLEAVVERAQPRTYVLEVLENNLEAIACYCTMGFVETRRLQCWTCEGGGADVPELAASDLDAIAGNADVDLAWQNSLASLRRASEPYVVLGDARGAAVVFPGSADLPLLAVARDARRRGHGRRLLAAAAARASRPLRILNIDARARGIADFLAAVGARPLVRQLEMERTG